MFQKMKGFTLLESIVTLTLSSITMATALSYFDDWITVSERTSLNYNQQVSSYAMQTHQVWARAAGRETPKWSEVVQISGLESHITSQGFLSLSTAHGQCRQLDSQGNLSSEEC